MHVKRLLWPGAVLLSLFGYAAHLPAMAEKAAHTLATHQAVAKTAPVSVPSVPATDCGCTAGPAPAAMTGVHHTPTARQARAQWSTMPLQFEPNQGQAPEPVKFLARGSGYRLALTARQAELTLRRRSAKSRQSVPVTVRMALAGSANPSPSMVGTQPLRGKINYLIGRDPRNWHTNIPTFRSVRYGGVYPGIDLVYYGKSGQLEYDFVIAPGSDAQAIRLAFGGGAAKVTDSGDLTLAVKGGNIGWNRPVAFQTIAGQRKAVEARFATAKDGTVGFTIGHYDKRLPLTIDPVLLYSTYLGGEGDEFAFGVAVDPTNMAYLTGDVIDVSTTRLPGSTFPVRSPSPQGPFQIENNDLTDPANSPIDAFVAKFDTTINGDGSLIYATYLGGTGEDHARSIAVDINGSAYVAGFTTSNDFPTKAGGADLTFGGGATNGTDAFVTKLSPDGSALAYSTYLGGAGDDAAYGIAVNKTFGATIVGETATTTAFKPAISTTAFQRTQKGGLDAFLVTLNADGTGASFATYFGGTGDDTAFAVALNPKSTIVYLTGKTTSTDLAPISRNAAQQTPLGSGQQAFVLAFDPARATRQVSYLSYLGGDGTNSGNAIIYGPDNRLDVVGSTSSTDFVTTNGEQTALGGGSDAFLTVINPAARGNSSIFYSTYIGGSGDDYGTGVTVQKVAGKFSPTVSITGYTNSINQANATPPGVNNEFTPVGTGSGFQENNGGQSSGSSSTSFDAFLAQIDLSQQDAASLTFLSYIGGSGDEIDQETATTGGPGCSVAFDSFGALYIAGATSSNFDFPTTTIDDGVGAYQETSGGGFDAFLFKVTFQTTLDDNTGIVLTTTPCSNTRTNGTVSLNAPAAADTVVNVTSSLSPQVKIVDPNNGRPLTGVTILAGETTATFAILTGSFTTPTQARITATYQGASKSIQVIVQPPSLQALQINGSPNATMTTPAPVGSGATVAGAVTLSCPANLNGQVIYLTSSNPAIAPVPDSVKVAKLVRAAQFSFIAGSVASATQVTITASETAGGAGFSVTFTITPPMLVKLDAAPNPVFGSTPVTGTATLNGPAPQGGSTVTLQSDNSAASVPASVVVPAGQSTATFTITTQTVQSTVNATITGTLNGISASVSPLTVQPLTVTSLTFDQTTLLAGATATGTVTLNTPAPTGGYLVKLTSPSAAVTVPATVTITSGQTSATFTATSQPVAQTTPVLVKASIANSSKTAMLTVTPQLVTSLTASPSSVSGGSFVTLVVTVSSPAPAQGTAVTLTSSDPVHVPVPAQLFIGAGKTSVTVVILTKGVNQNTTSTLTASFGSTTPRTATVTVVGASVQSLTLLPASVPGGGVSIGTVVLSALAPAGGAPVTLSSASSGVASVQSTVTVPEGARQISFSVQSHPVATTQTAVIKAAYNSSSSSAALTVTPIVGGAFGSGLQLFSVPYDYPTTSLDDLFGYSNVKLAVYTASTVTTSPFYAITPTAPADRIRLGRGYWARFPSAVTVTRTGIPADPSKNFSLALDAGWNMIGDPFLTSVSISGLLVQASGDQISFASASTGTNASVFPTLYSYPGGSGQAYISHTSTDSLQPGVGYWIYAFGRITLTFPHP